MTLTTEEYLRISARHTRLHLGEKVLCLRCVDECPCDAARLCSDVEHLQAALVYASEAGKVDERARIDAGVQGLDHEWVGYGERSAPYVNRDLVLDIVKGER